VPSEPSYVISCETTPVDFFHGIVTGKMHLIAFSCMSNINLRAWKGPVSFYNWLIDGGEYDRLWQEAGKGLGALDTGRIITTQAVSFALGCGIKRLVLLGNDLGFTDRFYVKESVRYHQNLLRVTRLTSIERAEMDTCRMTREYEIRRGEKVFYSNGQFIGAKYWLEDLFQRQDRIIIDSGVPGCSEKSTEKIGPGGFMKLFEHKKMKKR